MLLVSVILGGDASCRLSEFTVRSERNSGDGSAYLDVGSLGCQITYTVVNRNVFIQPVRLCFCSHGSLFRLWTNLGRCLQAGRRIKRPRGERNGSLGTGGESLRG